MLIVVCDLEIRDVSGVLKTDVQVIDGMSGHTCQERSCFFLLFTVQLGRCNGVPETCGPLYV